jgi:uncharacterized protein YndB with AHSA1/START domain
MPELEHIYETVIAAPPARVWEGLTTPAFTRQYFHATRIESDWIAGSRVEFRYDDGTLVVEGEVLEVDPPRRLSYTWHVLYDRAMSEEPFSRVTFDIEPLAGGSRLRVTHDRFAGDSAVYEQVRRGWEGIIEGLRSVLEAESQGDGG